jgi:thiamine-monophosphate kinase
MPVDRASASRDRSPGGLSPDRQEAAITVAELGEFGLIAAIQGLLPPDRALLLGIGDDAAVVSAPDGRVAATTDLLVEGRHFRRDWSAPFDVGVKAAAQNMADVAAMGAVPTALLIGLAAPGDLPVDWALDFVRGLAAESRRGGASVAGGDVTGSDTLMLAITALGDLEGRAPVTRAGARPGDVLAVAGRLGWSAGGLALLAAGRGGPPGSDQPGEDLPGEDQPAAGDQASGLAALVSAHRRPQPRYPAGPEAARLGATSMIDVSDGLIQDLEHVAAASGVCLDIDTVRLEAGPALRSAAAVLRSAAMALGADWLDWVLTGGEDHALAATFPAGRPLPDGWAVIGAARAGSGVLVDSRPRPGPGGWSHFR